MTKDESVRRINMELLDSGNGHYQFEGVQHLLVAGLRSTFVDEYTGTEYVGIKVSSGFEVEIEASIVRTATTQ